VKWNQRLIEYVVWWFEQRKVDVVEVSCSENRSGAKELGNCDKRMSGRYEDMGDDAKAMLMNDAGGWCAEDGVGRSRRVEWMAELWGLADSRIRGGSEMVEPVTLVVGSETSPEAGCLLSFIGSRNWRMSHDGVNNWDRLTSIKQPDAARVLWNLATVLPQASRENESSQRLDMIAGRAMGGPEFVWWTGGRARTDCRHRQRRDQQTSATVVGSTWLDGTKDTSFSRSVTNWMLREFCLMEGDGTGASGLRGGTDGVDVRVLTEIGLGEASSSRKKAVDYGGIGKDEMRVKQEVWQRRKERDGWYVRTR
jgi:hypothetical protein